MRTHFLRYGRFTAVSCAFAATMALSAPGLAQSTHSVAPVENSANEVERFCTNIADAARDRRYALQAQELETLRKDVDRRIELLEQKRAEYEDWLKRREEFLSKAEDNVVGIYSTMKPDSAAERLAELDTMLAAGILMKLEARKAGVILNEMDRKAAAAVTDIMVHATRKEDPS
jgi:flagellar motility protein MotE (MotC chaperone)